MIEKVVFVVWEELTLGSMDTELALGFQSRPLVQPLLQPSSTLSQGLTCLVPCLQGTLAEVSLLSHLIILLLFTLTD